MKRSAAAEAQKPEASETGLPLFRSWKAVYALVLGSFLLWLALLIALTRTFS
jgi:hypothetical protein